MDLPPFCMVDTVELFDSAAFHAGTACIALLSFFSLL